MFARVPQPGRRAHRRQQTFEVFARDFGALRQSGRRAPLAGPQKISDIADDPGLPQGRPPDHDPVGARMLEHFDGVVFAGAVAIGDHRNSHGSFRRRDRPPIGPACVKLLARAPMHGDHRGAFGFRASRKLRDVSGRFIPSQPHLDAQRHAYCLACCRDQPRRLIEIAHQRGAREASGDTLARTAHIDVDPVSPRGFGASRGGRHFRRLARGDLNDPGPRAGAFQPHRRFAIAAGDASGGHHLAHRRRRPQTRRDAAHGRVGHAGHRREQRATGERDPANAQRRRVKANA